MDAVDRPQFGLAPLPSSGTVVVERYSASGAKLFGFDVLLRYQRGSLSKDVAFAMVDGRQVWIGEEDQHQGPHEFDTADGRAFERVFVQYYPHGAPHHVSGLYISYWGDDPRLNAKSKLATADVAPVLAEWSRAMP